MLSSSSNARQLEFSPFHEQQDENQLHATQFPCHHRRPDETVSALGGMEILKYAHPILISSVPKVFPSVEPILAIRYASLPGHPCTQG